MAKAPLKSRTAAGPTGRLKHPKLKEPDNSSVPPIARGPGGGRRREEPGRRQITTFEELLTQGIKKGVIPARSMEARKWFRHKAARVRSEPGSLMGEDTQRLVGYPKIGRMYLFQYDPKHKKTLPYYDTYPLIFPIEPAKGGFLGINLHYLPSTLRAKLMDRLYDLTEMGKRPYDDATYLRISYGVLKGAAKYEAFKPCIKHYLASHVQSRFMEVYASEWDIACFLPLARFKKGSQEKVWRDSRRIING